MRWTFGKRMRNSSNGALSFVLIVSCPGCCELKNCAWTVAPGNTVWIVAFFPIVANTTLGLNSADRNLVDLFRLYGASRRQLLRYLRLPSALPYFLAGVRISGGLALIGAVVAEFFTAIGGLGYFILFNSRTFHQNEAFVAVLFLAGFGVGADALVTWGTRHYLPWYRRDEKVE